MAKAKKTVPLTAWEWELTWSSLRYFCGRKTIASACYPSDLIKNFNKRLSKEQKKMLSEDIKRTISMCKGDMMWEQIDMPIWSSLANYFDDSYWKVLSCEGKGIENQKVVAFPCEERVNGSDIQIRWIPVESYEKDGRINVSVYEDYIKEIDPYNE